MLINLKENKNPDINPFDEIMLGTTIYAGTPTKHMQKFIEKHSEMLTTKKNEMVG
jgi:menaquinone-dependent protoporphyrinogen IX oxidase